MSELEDMVRHIAESGGVPTVAWMHPAHYERISDWHRRMTRKDRRCIRMARKKRRGWA